MYATNSPGSSAPFVTTRLRNSTVECVGGIFVLFVPFLKEHLIVPLIDLVSTMALPTNTIE